MIKIKKLDKNDIGLAFSCTKDKNIWGSNEHQIVSDFLIKHLYYEFSAYGLTYNNEPAGHLIITKTETHYSPIRAKNSVYIYCMYISPLYRSKNFGTVLLEFMEEDIFNKEQKEAIFVQSLGDEYMNKTFFIKNNYKEIENDILNSLLVKYKDTMPDYEIPQSVNTKTKNEKNVLIVNYNPVCPVLLGQYKMAITYLKKHLPKLKIVENYIKNDNDIDVFGNYGFYLNNMPILVNPNKLNELKEIIENLIS